MASVIWFVALTTTGVRVSGLLLVQHATPVIVYPDTGCSPMVYTPAATGAFVTGPAPSTPAMPGVGPLAVSVNALSSSVPPLSLTTFFASVSRAGRSSLVIWHVTEAPAATVTTLSVMEPSVQIHTLAS